MKEKGKLEKLGMAGGHNRCYPLWGKMKEKGKLEKLGSKFNLGRQGEVVK